jgi:hypothetical protein
MLLETSYDSQSCQQDFKKFSILKNCDTVFYEFSSDVIFHFLIFNFINHQIARYFGNFSKLEEHFFFFRILDFKDDCQL